MADYIPVPGVYAAGRLDADSEGLVVLTDDGAMQARISDPRHKLAKIYWAQVEGLATDEALCALAAGVDLGDFVTRPCEACRVAEPPGLWVQTEDGREWFVTNTYRIRPAGEGTRGQGLEEERSSPSP